MWKSGDGRWNTVATEDLGAPLSDRLRERVDALTDDERSVLADRLMEEHDALLTDWEALDVSDEKRYSELDLPKGIVLEVSPDLPLGEGILGAVRSAPLRWQGDLFFGLYVYLLTE